METYYKTCSVSVTLVFVPGVHRPCETTKIFPAKSNRKWILSPGLVTRHCMAFVLHRNRLSPYSLFLSYRQTLMLSVISSLSHWTHTLFLPAEFSLSLSPFIPLLLFSPYFSHLGPSGRLPPTSWGLSLLCLNTYSSELWSSCSSRGWISFSSWQYISCPCVTVGIFVAFLISLQIEYTVTLQIHSTFEK